MGEVKVRYSYVIEVRDAIKDRNGEVTELRCSHDPESRDAMPTDRKVKSVIHWVSARHAVSCNVRLYDHLFKADSPSDEAVAEDALETVEEEDHEDGEKKTAVFLKKVNPQSLVELSDAKLEHSLFSAKPCDRFQFERNGVVVVDKYSGQGSLLTVNRTLGLKESGFKKEESVVAAARSRKEEQAKKAQEKEARKRQDPRDILRTQTDPEGNAIYTQFDDDGVPAHDQKGDARGKTRYKKLKREREKQKKIFES